MGVSAERFGNDPKYTGSILQDVIVPETQPPPASSCEEFVALPIDVRDVVLTAIGFDDQSCFDANEIDNVGWDGELTPKAMT